MPSRCKEIAALASRSPSAEPERSCGLERLAFRDLGEDGRARDLSGFAEPWTVPFELTDDPERADRADRADFSLLVVRFDEELDWGDCGGNCRKSFGVAVSFTRSMALLGFGVCAFPVMAGQGNGSGFLPIGVPGVQPPADNGVLIMFPVGRQ